MEISMELVKDLRQRTGAGIMDCRTALQQAEGNIDGAIDYLRRKGLATAAKKAGRIATDGLVSSYIHAGGKIGVLVEINCETDFVGEDRRVSNLRKKYRHADRRCQSSVYPKRGDSARCSGKGENRSTGRRPWIPESRKR